MKLVTHLRNFLAGTFLVVLSSTVYADEPKNCDVYIKLLKEGTKAVNGSLVNVSEDDWKLRAHKINTVVMISQSEDFKHCENSNATVKKASEEFLAAVEKQNQRIAQQNSHNKAS